MGVFFCAFVTKVLAPESAIINNFCEIFRDELFHA